MIEAAIAQAVNDAITRTVSAPAEMVPTLPKAGARHRQARRQITGRAKYYAVKPGKAGAKTLGIIAERLRPVYSAIVASKRTGLDMLALEKLTKRTTKQIENDLMWLRTAGHIVSDRDRAVQA